MKTIMMKVWVNKANQQKLVTIPKDCDIHEGDYVQIKKIGGEDDDLRRN
jgi:hypothetical protein